ncbi:MAG TPA: putative zinc-binding metallopeptidase [Pirellulales bacterium]|nr:putative zinc-binding metallopeptidase [Pirellulales bacterium]
MRTYSCTCGNRLFFENNRCLNCGLELAFCPQCRRLSPIRLDPDGLYRCCHDDCQAQVVKCDNYRRHQVCNRAVLWSGAASRQHLCDCCCYNEMIPDLSVPGNRGRWYRLEAAKRRLIYGLDLLGLPRDAADGPPRLTFQFLADTEDPRRPGAAQQAVTGHCQGRITINIREADDDERERLRVQFGEAHRTLIGHFRHEIGHYYWERLVRGRVEGEFKAAFGDHEQPGYGEALERYYQFGAPADWAERCLSAYAAMHPWEDFAETFGAYLDMVCLLDSARNQGLPGSGATQPSLDTMLLDYHQIGIAMNEMNRSVGLVDLVPEVFVAPIVSKLRFVHQLVCKTSPQRAAG